MINILIYLKKDFAAGELVKHLLKERLIASASIDYDNMSYKTVNGEITELVFNVITAQSRAMLFKEIIRVVEEKVGSDVIINSTPIVGSNKSFDDWVMSNTAS